MKIIAIDPEELVNIIRAELEATLSAKGIKTNGASDPDDRDILTRTEIARLFRVTLPTIHAWMNSGILPFHRMGGRVYFKKGEVLQAMKSAKIHRLR